MKVLSKIENYLKLVRITKPIGIFLLFLPCLFALAVITKTAILSHVTLIILLFIGSTLMRSAACVINDLFDAKIDAKVSRTKNRPIAAQKISKKNAIIFLIILLLPSLLILLQFNKATIISGFFITIFVGLYPLMKRFTFYPQIFLGFTINFGVIMVSLQLQNAISLEIALLYFYCILWTILYDTIYGFQDLDDDLLVGVKSMAIKFKNNPKRLIFLLVISMAIIINIIGLIGNYSANFFIINTINFLILINRIKKYDLFKIKHCAKLFNFSLLFGTITLISLILS